MTRPTEHKYMSSGKEWTAELFLMFVCGFALASLFWVAVWFFHSRPAHADALQEQETALEKCTAQTREFDDMRNKILAEKEAVSRRLEESDRKLQEARQGWGRCIRSKRSGDNQNTAAGNSSVGPSARLRPVSEVQ